MARKRHGSRPGMRLQKSCLPSAIPPFDSLPESCASFRMWPLSVLSQGTAFFLAKQRRAVSVVFRCNLYRERDRTSLGEINTSLASHHLVL